MEQTISADSLLPSFIDEAIVLRTLCRYDINPLYRYLVSVFGDKEATELMRLYRVGTSRQWGGASVLWQTDICGRVRSGKIMSFDPKTGQRVQPEEDKTCWAHVAMQLADFRLRQCFFGEHLLAQFPDRAVMIVASEKSAIVCHHFMPDYVWLATGDQPDWFHGERVEALRGRDVTLFPSLRTYKKWGNSLPVLSTICRSVHINDYVERTATDEQRAQGLDIADFLLLTDTPQSILQRMMARNPALRMLVDRLQLEVVED